MGTVKKSRSPFWSRQADQHLRSNAIACGVAVLHVPSWTASYMPVESIRLLPCTPRTMHAMHVITTFMVMLRTLARHLTGCPR